MPNEFQPGDVVQLKSGGPRMTVESVTGENGPVIIHCSWFDKNNLLERSFIENLLTKCKSPASGVSLLRS